MRVALCVIFEGVRSHKSVSRGAESRHIGGCMQNVKSHV